MLVLRRKVNESIMIGDDIVVTILAVDGERVKLGIEAPAQVRILRQELYDALKEENLRAASSPKGDSDAVLPSLRDLFRPKEDDD